MLFTSAKAQTDTGRDSYTGVVSYRQADQGASRAEVAERLAGRQEDFAQRQR
jgi:hypothetical protein